MGIWGIILIAIAIVALFAIFYISIYNKMQYGNTKVEHVEGMIDEDLRSKYDIVVRADDVIKNHLKSKKDYLKEFVSLKDAKISNFDLERKLKEAENLILNLFHDYPELSENENMVQIIRQMNVFNAFIRKFPNNIIAKIHHFYSRPFFDRKDMTDTDINDFKL